ncbi:hypothetical protein [Paenibacillus cookii]|uniref:Uncharacterized protein n=1 Tax=Paenibacillus cookii TaxID=157839 RepID=A0ABQ4LYM9_9BACL|nr:hypothetical protein [Paenibacillus cookii]KHF35871.1 hypothetical protein CM49_01809 [Paenibacillus sp. P1XP2]GIO67846.1 hypothetical protein J21TS3_26670 [Paenibacillus cookii]
MDYKGRELNCTEEELKNFIDGLNVMFKVYKFSDKFNGQNIQNPTELENARYYVLQVGDRTFLQPHAPFEAGIVPITDENAHDYIERHAEMLTDEAVYEKFAVRPEDALKVLERKNAELQALADDLKQRNAAMQDDQLFILEALANQSLI